MWHSCSFCSAQPNCLWHCKRFRTFTNPVTRYWFSQRPQGSSYALMLTKFSSQLVHVKSHVHESLQEALLALQEPELCTAGCSGPKDFNNSFWSAQWHRFPSSAVWSLVLHVCIQLQPSLCKCWEQLRQYPQFLQVATAPGLPRLGPASWQLHFEVPKHTLARAFLVLS